MSQTAIIIIGAVLATSYFLGSIFVGPDRHGGRAQHLRDVIATAGVFSGYTVVAAGLHMAFPGPITTLFAIGLLVAVTWTYSFYRSSRARRARRGTHVTFES